MHDQRDTRRQLEEKNRLLDAFQQMSRLVLDSLDREQILGNLAHQIIRAGIFRSLMMALVHRDSRTVEVVGNYVCMDEKGKVTPGEGARPSIHVIHKEGHRIIVSDTQITGTTYSLDDDNITPEVARTGEMAVIDSWSDKFDDRAGAPASRRGNTAYFIPVKKGDEVVAVLATGSLIEDKEETLGRIRAMQPLLDQVAIALENARLFGELQREMARRQRMEQELVRLERLRAAGELAAGVSHNLNNILTTISGPAALIKLQTDDSQILENVEEILSSSRRASELVSRLYRSVRGMDNEVLAPVLAEAVIREAVQTTRPRWARRTQEGSGIVNVEVKLAETPHVRAAESRLHEVITNLIFNAVDAMPEGGTITIETRQLEKEVLLLLGDTGIGMDEAVSRRIFEPFFTTKGETGTGLGLSTVYNVVSSWNGRIEVESSPGAGTTFSLYLPIWRE